jgi:hypothetical protein
MRSIRSSLDNLGYTYFTCAEDAMVVFRGSLLDHHILLNCGGDFLRATVILAAWPDALSAQAAGRILRWNAELSFARVAEEDGRLVLLADLPCQGVADESIRQWLMGIVAAAEAIGPEALRMALPSTPGHSAPPPEIARTAPDCAAPPSTPAPDNNEDDQDIDWNA